ncbi:MAG TPA: hypothetical protein VJI97_03230 [Candidatus Nanoarchaeia archaeon]|nr:hypothetical protein [Candidatus Nanoarchaeia archaeon]
MPETLIGKIVLWGSLLVFVVIFSYVFFSDEGMLKTIAKLALKTERFLPFGTDKDVGTTTSIDAAVLTSHSKFTEEVDKYAANYGCLIDADFSAFDGYTLEIANTDRITSTILKPVNEKGIVVDNKGFLRLNQKSTESNSKICMVNPDTFHKCYYLNQGCNPSSLFVSANKLEVTKDKVLFEDKSHSYANGMLFKPTQDEVCFIPTHSGFGTWFGCDADAATMDNDCVDFIKSKIPKCSVGNGNIPTPRAGARQPSDATAVAR